MFEKTDVGNAPCSMGMDQKLAVLFTYVFGWIGALVFFLVEKNNKFVRFSAMQSIMINAVWLTLVFTLSVLSSAPVFGFLFSVLSYLTSIAFVTAIVFLAISGYKSEKIKLPILGDFAERWS
jgi:uncharacterized membrane protein